MLKDTSDSSYLTPKPFISGVVVSHLEEFSDERGSLFELWSNRNDKSKYLQDTIVKCKKNVLRGMHYQIKSPYSQLITVISGKIFDVVLDLRQDSPTFKKAQSFILSSNGSQQLYMPPGIAHGYVSLSDDVIISYKCDTLYSPGDEGGVLWSSLDDVDWPVDDKTLINKRDTSFSSLRNLEPSKYPLAVSYKVRRAVHD